jgi:hypothetical protein
MVRLPVCLFMLGDVGRYAFLDHHQRKGKNIVNSCKTEKSWEGQQFTTIHTLLLCRIKIIKMFCFSGNPSKYFEYYIPFPPIKGIKGIKCHKIISAFWLTFLAFKFRSRIQSLQHITQRQYQYLSGPKPAPKYVTRSWYLIILFFYLQNTQFRENWK